MPMTYWTPSAAPLASREHANTAIVLGRTKHGIRFAGRGRDTEDFDKLAEFDRDTWRWSITGEYDEADPKTGMAAGRMRVLDLLENSPLPLMPVDIANQLQLPRTTVRSLLHRMVNSIPQQAVRRSDGSYGAVPAGGQP
jgi:hypothetical protein